MKHLFILMLSVLMSSQSIADQTLELVVQREITKKKLEKLGYTKWLKLRNAFIQQSLVVQKVKLAFANNRRKELLLTKQLNEKASSEVKALNQSADNTKESAHKKALALAQNNSKHEANLTNIRIKTEQLKQNITKQVKLLTQVEALELKYRKIVESNKDDINKLLKLRKELDEKVQASDTKSDSKSP